MEFRIEPGQVALRMCVIRRCSIAYPCGFSTYAATPMIDCSKRISIAAPRVPRQKLRACLEHLNLSALSAGLMYCTPNVLAPCNPSMLRISS